ncbi:hypothetical protein C1701_22075 [Actinoalloteichus sp. AHMU CJ021]|uniref:Uncharacterized protein n=1 Tax=Actinoalloteichus caeruleus DSM 43889 TaxID=1120930 RepID=A0ABT1JBS8_ACTCY|nr:hypothetical protein C1701_22075 [Actinoalloteichus sp. AHMU CJ021]MCP2329952.1 hypothetical protein [Actinoalloteichus caeruleus DSM 43889]
MVSGAGLVVAVVGTFLPWLRSGSTYRDSHQTVGVLRRFGLVEGTPVEYLLPGWPMLVPLAAAILLLHLAGWSRTGAALGVVFSLLAGTVGVIASVQGITSAGLITVMALGPVTTALGAVVVLIGSLGALVVHRTTFHRQQEK